MAFSGGERHEDTVAVHHRTPEAEVSDLRSDLLRATQLARAKVIVAKQPTLRRRDADGPPQLADVSIDATTLSRLRLVPARMELLVKVRRGHGCVLLDVLERLRGASARYGRQAPTGVQLLPKVQVPEPGHKVPMSAELRFDAARQAPREVEQFHLRRLHLVLQSEVIVDQGNVVRLAAVRASYSGADVFPDRTPPAVLAGHVVTPHRHRHGEGVRHPEVEGLELVHQLSSRRNFHGLVPGEDVAVLLVDHGRALRTSLGDDVQRSHPGFDAGHRLRRLGWGSVLVLDQGSAREPRAVRVLRRLANLVGHEELPVSFAVLPEQLLHALLHGYLVVPLRHVPPVTAVAQLVDELLHLARPHLRTLQGFHQILRTAHDVYVD